MKILCKHVPAACLIGSWFLATWVYSAEPGLIGHWRLDEAEGTVVHDRSGNNNEGEIHAATWTQGSSGTALKFDGTKSWVRVPNSNSLIPRNNQVSVLVWFSPGILSPDIHHLVAKWGDYYVRLAGPEHVMFAVYEQGQERICGTPFKFQPGEWYYLAATYDGQSLAVYVDGDRIASQSPCPPVKMDQDDKHDLHLGSASWGVAEFFEGQLGEIKIYNRALTQDEVLREGGQRLTPRMIAILKHETLATKEGLQMVERTTKGRSDQELAACRRNFASLQARFAKVEQALVHEQTLTSERVCALCQENRAILTEVEDLAYRFGLEFLFLEDN